MKIKCKSFVWVVVVFNLILSICGNIVVINSNNNRKFLSTSTTTTSTTTATTSATTANLNRVSSTTESSNLSQKSTTSSSAASNDLPDSNNAVDGKGAPGATTPKIVDLTTPATPPRKRNLNLTKDATATTTSTTTISSTTPSSTTSKTVTNNGNTNSTITNVKIYPTTYRPSRQTSLNSTDRDSQLMNLLAARRNALQRDRTYRPHRRTPTTGRTSEELVSLVDISTSSTSVTNIESTSKAPNDSRSICVRNCTKNFTKRTTASCMRQCAGIKRANATQPSARTKVDEKDNNEILLTDESSHGFFVVTKDLNDTVNHIAPSTEKTRKLRNKSRQPVAAVVDDGPYGYYGQKLQTNRPTVLRINQVSDDLPKILEVSAVPRPQTPVERSRSRSRYNRVSAFSRRQGVANVTRTGTPVSTTLRAITSTATPSTIPTLSTPTTSHTIILLKDEVIPPKYKDVQIGFKPKLRDDSFKPIKSEISLNLNERSVVLDQVQERQPIVQVLPPTTTSTVATTTTTKTTTRATTTTTTTTPKPTTTTSTTTTTTRRPTTTTPPSTPLLIAVPEVEVPRETTRYVVITSTRPQPTTTTTTEIPIKQIIEEKEGSESNNGDQPNLIVFLNRTEDDIRTAPTTARSPVDSPDKVASENSSSFFEIFGNSVQIPEDSKVTELNISKEESEVKIETNSMNAAAYVLSGLGMLPIVVIAVYLVRVFVTKKWTKHHNDLDICVTDQQPISPVRKMCKHDDDDDDNDSRDDGYSITSDQEIDRKNLHFKCLLGEGNFGQVWKAEADDLTGHYGTTRIVAVKTVRSGSTQDGLKEEAAIMKKLGSHPNVVTILGACLEAEPHLLIMEYAMRGRLLSLLRAARSANNILPASVPGGRSLAPLSPRTLGGFALDIARGMEYISDRKIVHRDLAARNVLLDHNGVCKICDFGMSIDLDQKSRNKHMDLMQRPKTNHGLDHRFKFDFGNRLITQWSHSFSNSDEKKHNHDEGGKRPALPIRWMAPEALQYHLFSTETDVWAFGIVLWEIATLGCTPYPNLSGREVVRMVPTGTRPDYPSEGRTEFYDLMSACWHKDPRQRPTFREARYEISKTLGKWVDDDATSDYMDVSGFSEDLEHGMVYFNRRISEFECDI